MDGRPKHQFAPRQILKKKKRIQEKKRKKMGERRERKKNRHSPHVTVNNDWSNAEHGTADSHNYNNSGNSSTINSLKR